MSQRPDCRDAKHTCRRLCTEEVERTYCGKTSKKDKNTAVIFKEHRTNQILRSNENRWIGSKQDFWSFWKLHVQERQELCHKLVSHPTQVHRRCQADKHDTGRVAGIVRWWERSRWSATLRPMHHLEETPCPEGDGQGLCGQKVGQECQRNPGKKKKQHWAEEGPQLDSARKLRRIYSIDPEDKEFYKTLEAERQKLDCIRCNAVRIVKDLREFILGGAWGHPQGKIRDEQWQERSLAKITRRKTKLFSHVFARLTNWQESAEQRLRTKIMKILRVTKIQCTNLFLCPRQWRPRVRRPQLTKTVRSRRIIQHSRNQ